jgi:NAD(P)-dependent dehydrogenase (short-subunit alcohol dehydrogenase family)
MGDHLKGKNAVVTGAGRGIGRAVALALAEEGANVVVCRRGGPADEVVEGCKKFGVEAVAYYGDVADFKVAEGIVKSCVDNFGRIDILCNIAGTEKPGMIPDISEKDWDEMLAVHLKGTFNLIRHAVPLMMEQRDGRIINTISELFPFGIGHAHYAAAKGGIVSLTYAVAFEMGKYGIRCNAFAPRARTGMIEDESNLEGFKKILEAGLVTPERLKQSFEEMTPPSAIAPFIAYLASDAAANLNGKMFFISGRELGIWNRPAITRRFPRDYEKEGRWTFEEVEKLVPEKLLRGP